MAKTYVPTLIRLVHALCMYITRYQDRIRSNLAGDALAAFDALSAACTAFVIAVPPETPIS